MLDFLTSTFTNTDTNSVNAISLIKADHDKVKDLFEQFEKADNLREKKRIAAEAIMELKIHAEIEEKIFYPAVRKQLEDDLMNEADEEHHVAKLLIAELDQMDGTEDHWEAKFTVLAENVRHHIKEEEGDMLPEAGKLDMDFDAIGQKLLAMKSQLKQNGVPASDEEKLMKRSKQPADSPARAAKAKPTLKVKSSAKPKTATRKKAAAKKTVTKKAAPKKSVTKKAPARKAATKKPSTRRAAARKTPLKASATSRAGSKPRANLKKAARKTGSARSAAAKRRTRS